MMKQNIKVKTDSNEIQCLYSQDVVYHDYGDCKRHLQMVFPYRQAMKADEKYPLILLIPGSAWHKQEMYNDIPQYAILAKRGFVVAAMEYRESDLATFPAQVEDVCNALKFIPGIADIFHIDTDKIFLMGNSSGGHIAMMSVLLHAHGLCDPLPKILGVICQSGSTDLVLCANEPLPPWMTVRPSAVLLGVDDTLAHKELAAKASCPMYITEDIELPPILLMHSEFDPVVSVANSRTLYEKLTASHHKAAYYELEGNDAHGGAVFYDRAILDIVQEFCEKCLTQAIWE